ncbi:MAG: SLBB domain-containing protein [Armatimonadota bacterium]
MTVPVGRPWTLRAILAPPSVAIRNVLGIASLLVVLCSPAGFAEAVDAPVYTIRAGDSLDIQVAGHDEWSLSVSVRPDGRITYPATGEIEVAGLTLDELTEQIEYALGPGGRHLRDPKVFINVTGLRTPVAYLLGAVAAEGSVELPTGVSTATMLLTINGGPAPGADLSRVTLHRADGERETIDLAAQLDGQKQPTTIYAGDVLMVPSTETRYIGVLGAAGTRGEIPLPPDQDGFDMLDLLVKIGGVSESADRDRAMILRADGSIDSFNVDRVMNREIDPPWIRAGDVLWLPPAPPEPETEYFSVTGAVRAAGRYEHREGITLADALALSGEFSEAANAEELTIIHADGEKTVIDVRPMLHGHDTDMARTPIQPDDIVLVPAHDKSYVMLGAVGQTGFFTWDEDIRLADALAKSGGLGQNAAQRKVLLVRRAEDGGSPTVVQIDAHKLLQGENEAANWKLMPGDTVYVPQREPQRGIRDAVSEPLAVLGIIGALERVFNW